MAASTCNQGKLYICTYKNLFSLQRNQEEISGIPKESRKRLLKYFLFFLEKRFVALSYLSVVTVLYLDSSNSIAYLKLIKFSRTFLVTVVTFNICLKMLLIHWKMLSTYVVRDIDENCYVKSLDQRVKRKTKNGKILKK